jgi:hypothetical protein
MALAMAATGLSPAYAAPLSVSPSVPSSPVINVQGPQDWSNRGQRSRERRGQQRNEFRRGGPREAAGRDFQRRGNNYYYRGHRGSRERRPGYRQYQGWWFPSAAFIAGAIIGGANRGPGLSNAHVQWCYDRYRSYRASDNTFQPYNGPRRQCNSPYG